MKLRMKLSESFLTSAFDRANPPALDRTKRVGTLSLKALRALTEPYLGGFDGPRGQVAQGLLFLWHDHWEEAHQIAQSDEGEADHDLLHAIVHRKENDFANSSYWFREAGHNPAFKLVEIRTTNLLVESAMRESILPGAKWSSAGFLTAVKKGKPEPLLRALQAEEIIAFFETLVS